MSRSAEEAPSSSSPGRPAVVEIWGIPFCERGAREQAAYFAIGETTQELTADRATLNELLIEPKGSIPAEGGKGPGRLVHGNMAY
jgi:hypothetical protein